MLCLFIVTRLMLYSHFPAQEVSLPRRRGDNARETYQAFTRWNARHEGGGFVPASRDAVETRENWAA